MSSNTPYIQKVLINIILFSLAVSILYILFGPEDKSYINEYNLKMESLETKIDSLHNVNNDLVVEIKTLNTQIVVLDQEISKQDSKIVTLKKQTNEKVNNVDLYRYDELERFFTERYRQYIDQTKKTDSTISN
jgi:cell division protein FtsB